MVSLDQLAAFDCLLWLGSSQRAALLEQTNQSTIVRRSNTTTVCFDLKLKRGAVGLLVRGNTELLEMERQLHQRARLLGRRPLRLQAPLWTLEGGLFSLPPGWCCNPPSPTAVCENPLQLLQARVIDAALLTPTQMPESREGLACLDVYSSPIELTLVGGPRGRDSQALDLTGIDPALLQLQQPPFLPRSCLTRCRDWFSELIGVQSPARAPSAPARPFRKEGGEPMLRLAFLTPEMRRLQPLPCGVDHNQPVRPYVERLVVLEELAEAEAVRRLQDHLIELFSSRPGLRAS